MPPAGSLPDRAPARSSSRSRTRAAALLAVAALTLAGAGCGRGARAADLAAGSVVAVADDENPPAEADASAAPGDAPRPAPPRTAPVRTAAPRTSPTSTETPTTGPVTTTSAASPPAATPEAAPEEALTGPAGVFRPDGLGFVRFGDDAEVTVTRLEQRYGPPDFDSAWATEDGRTFRQLAFGPLAVDLREEGGTRTFTGARYLVPGEGAAPAPRFDTDPPRGLDRPGPVSFARLTGGARLTPSPDLPGVWCFATASGQLCASSGELPTDGNGATVAPSPDTPVTALLAGRIAFRSHCGV
jgi:hypothetical protein